MPQRCQQLISQFVAQQALRKRGVLPEYPLWERADSSPGGWQMDSQEPWLHVLPLSNCRVSDNI